jgi:hypothetical protein
MMRRIAELEIESQITRVALAKLAVMKADADRGTGVRGAPVISTRPGSPGFEGKPVPVPRIRVVRISGSKEDSDTCNPRFEMKTGGFEGTSCKLVGLGLEAKLMPSDKWAGAMASIRTDLDQFSQQELQALETWGYEQARSAWPAPSRERADGGRRPPGWRPDQIGEPPTDEQLTKFIERSARRKLRIATVRDFSGVALLVIMTALGLVAVWQIARLWL